MHSQHLLVIFTFKTTSAFQTFIKQTIEEQDDRETNTTSPCQFPSLSISVLSGEMASSVSVTTSPTQTTPNQCLSDGRVAFVTGGAGTICSMQVRALVRLGANACILGRSVEKTEAAAKDIESVRPGAKVLGIGDCDVRKVSR